MKKIILCFIITLSYFSSQSQTVSSIAALYHNGQVFITWNNIANADTGFYYVYENSVPITSSNIQSSHYIGRVPNNSSFDFRFTSIYQTNQSKYFVTNDNPLVKLTALQGFFVMNCTQNLSNDYFAVRCDFGMTSANWQVSAGNNATTSSVTEHLDPIKAYLQDKISVGSGTDTMFVYVHYGTNVSANGYPAMANEGCVPFHFGLVRNGDIGGNNSCYLKFHGGGGDFINNGIPTFIAGSWKISYDDWIPAYNYDPSGSNTRWIGYSNKLDIYNFTKSSAPPTSGTIKCYTHNRVLWELKWVEQNWPNTIDTTRIYLVGTSAGSAGALLSCLLEPDKYAAADVPDVKFNLRAPNDDNPNCKYNDGNSGSDDVATFLGDDDSTNLTTDMLKPGTSNTFFRIYDLTDMNFMYHFDVYKSIPFIYAVSGKNDHTTCWEEKIPAYDTIQLDRAGGVYYWDLRTHSGGSDNAWPSLKLTDLGRYATNKSYPGFSNSALDGNPGSASNPAPPYYSGDDVGSLHGNVNWDVTSVKDSANSWQVNTFTFQDTLNDGTLIPLTLPNFSKTDITIKRAQKFKGFAKQQTLYWINIHNGDTVQNGTIKQTYSGTIPKPLTVKKVKIYHDGNTFRIQTTNPFARFQQPQALVPLNVQVYPNPFTDQLQVQVNLVHEGSVMIRLANLLGEEMLQQKFDDGTEGGNYFSLTSAALHSGIYILQVITPDGEYAMKVEKE